MSAHSPARFTFIQHFEHTYGVFMCLQPMPAPKNSSLTSGAKTWATLKPFLEKVQSHQRTPLAPSSFTHAAPLTNTTLCFSYSTSHTRTMRGNTPQTCSALGCLMLRIKAV